jgi:hypothetical protein
MKTGFVGHIADSTLTRTTVPSCREHAREQPRDADRDGNLHIAPGRYRVARIEDRQAREGGKPVDEPKAREQGRETRAGRMRRFIRCDLVLLSLLLHRR